MNIHKYTFFLSFTKFIYFYPQVPGKPMEFNHNQSGIQYKDEGPMQYFTVPTQKLEVYEYVYISVWAVNEVMYIYCDISYAELVSAISNGISVPQ